MMPPTDPMTPQRLREIADRLAMRCLPCDMPYAVQEAAELRTHADQIERNTAKIAELEAQCDRWKSAYAESYEQHQQSKRHLDAIAEALHPGKPKFTEDRWTYQPDQLPEMVRALQEKNEHWWDQHSVQCGNCSVEIVTRKGSIPNNNGLSDSGGSEDEHLCGRCAGAQMYDYADRIAELKDAESLLASTADLMNSWAREWGVTETYNEKGAKVLLGELWDKAANIRLQRDALTEQLAAARADGERLRQVATCSTDAYIALELRAEKLQAALKAFQEDYAEDGCYCSSIIGTGKCAICMGQAALPIDQARANAKEEA